MKLNATAEMFPISWPEFAKLHPFAPDSTDSRLSRDVQAIGAWLAEITGFAAVSLQPNAGSQGEYAGLLAIREYHASRGRSASQGLPHPAISSRNESGQRRHGRLQGRCQSQRLKDGDIDLADLRAKADAHAKDLAALMVTYPSTHGVFETTIREICEIVHQHGGQVYMDGANMNAQVGLCRPGDYRRRRLPSELAQNFLHSTRRRRPGHGPDWCGETSRCRFCLRNSDGQIIKRRTWKIAVGPIAAAP